ncbi:unnamed protein product [Auanema sp. JU1783]|nr:unnamed protein product [Auanema sp. JU1783]
MTTAPPLEEDKGVLKSGVVTAAFAPVKSKKNFYAVLSERALELHDSEKYYRKRKPPRHLVDLSVAFNVHNDHLDAKLKKCVCLMGPDDTLCIRAENEAMNLEWYESILRAVIPSRAFKLCRPVQVGEFFENAWDVEIVLYPKLRRILNTDDVLPSMCDRQPDLKPGKRRLCFYPHTIVLCKKRIEPATIGIPPSGIPPFPTESFIELPRMFIAFFGSQEKYFLIRMGRGSPTGACELWAQCESEEVANDMHSKLNYIIERETEKKKKMNGGDNLPTLRSHHRERSHTQPLHMRCNSTGLESTEEEVSSIIVPAPAYVSARDRRAMLRDCKALIDSFEEESNRSPVQCARLTSIRPRGSLGNPSATQMELLGRRKCSPVESTSTIGRKISHQGMNPSGSFSARCSTISTGSSEARSSGYSPAWNIFPPTGRRSSNTSSIKEESTYQEMAPLSTTSTEETEDSGGTLRCENGSTREEQESTRSSQHSLIIAEATIEHRMKDVSSSDNDERSSVGGVSRLSAETQEDYTPMDIADWHFGSNSHLIVPPQYDRESCYSSMAANSSSHGQTSQSNPPRAYSFGGRGNLKPANLSVAIPADSSIPDCNEASTSLVPPYDDPRKRAFSLGSKSFFPRPFKKTSHTNRAQRLSQTSAGSSGASCFGPSSSSTNHLVNAVDKEGEYSRNRSESFGSGRSTPYTRRVIHSNDQHVEMDFGGIGRSGSGSVASIDSPTRSRTSSLCSGRKEDYFHNTEVLEGEDVAKPRRTILQPVDSKSHEDRRMQRMEVADAGDYVLTECISSQYQASTSHPAAIIE